MKIHVVRQFAAGVTEDYYVDSVQTSADGKHITGLDTVVGIVFVAPVEEVMKTEPVEAEPKRHSPNVRRSVGKPSNPASGN
jgi:hypothetical protein